MSYLTDFKDPELSKKLLVQTFKWDDVAPLFENRPLRSTPKSRRTVSIMEVCGSHTMSIYKNGINRLLPSYIHLLSGPGCPVCVTDTSYIDQALILSQNKNVILASFGDMLKVPGSHLSLSTAKAKGASIQVVYSPLDCLQLAKGHPEKEIVFLGIGFETTAPVLALTLKEALRSSLRNFSMLLSLKTMPNAMKNLILHPDVKIDGFICPGHVAAVIGSEPFNTLAKAYSIPMVIAGFEPVDLSSALYTLIQMILDKNYCCENLYKRVVRAKGNLKALALLNEVFELTDSSWRGLGMISETGLSFKPPFNIFDASLKFNLTSPKIQVPPGCLCGDILKGIKKPYDCPLYKTKCTPSSPIGPCMVSMEGTCMNFYNYND